MAASPRTPGAGPRTARGAPAAPGSPQEPAQKLGARRPGWLSADTAALIRQVERLVELDRDLPAFLAEKRKPSGPEEQLELASLCRYPAKRLYVASARFYADAFAAKGSLADDLAARHRYNAACSAAQAGCGRREDKPKPDDEVHARPCWQALGWLKTHLGAWAKVLDKAPLKGRPVVRRTLTQWQADDTLAGVRGKEALDKLPEAERKDWPKLWADVAAQLRRATAAR